MGDVLELALGALGAAVAVVSESGEVRFESETCRELLGVSLAEVTPDVFLRRCHADDAESAASTAFAEERELRWWVLDGWRRIKTQRVAETPSGVVLVLSDVTDTRALFERAGVLVGLLDASVELSRDGCVVADSLGMSETGRVEFAESIRRVGEVGYVTAAGRLWRATVRGLQTGAMVALRDTADVGTSIQRDAVWRLVVESLTEGLLLLGGDGSILECNSAALMLLGMERKDVIGASVRSVAAELESTQPGVNVAWVRNGRELLLECARVPLMLGETVWSTVLVVRDVTKESELTAALERERRALLEVNEELRAVVAGIANTRGRERAALARRIHDDPIQRLAGMRWRVAGTDPRMAADLEECCEALRVVVLELRSQMLTERGLTAALMEMEELDDRVVVRAGGVDDVDPETADLVWRNIREVVRNSIAHSKATSIEVAVGRDGEMLVCEVKDDGRGVTAEELHRAERQGHIGVASVRETVAEAGGTFFVMGVETGTTVRMVIPGRWRTL